MIIKDEETSSRKKVVTFRLHRSVLAHSAHVVGDFNNWNRHSHPLRREGEGVPWELTMELEKGREYQFRYLIDGESWQDDWRPDRYAPNAFGGANSVIET